MSQKKFEFFLSISNPVFDLNKKIGLKFTPDYSLFMNKHKDPFNK